MTSAEGKESGRQRLYLLVAALGLVTFLLASIYGVGLAHTLPGRVGGALDLLMAPLVIFMLFSPLFASLTWFFGLLALALMLAVGTLVRACPPRLLRYYLAAGALLLAAAPLLLPTVYGQYTLAVEAEEGVEMLWPTQPRQRFASAFKNAQRVHERYGCTYHLLGWSEDEVLYYEAACDGRAWAFDPAAGEAPREVAGPPATLHTASIERIRPGPGGAGYGYPSHPPGFPPDARNHVITYQKALSPQGRWVAAAIMNYYGPRDVVVLSR